MRTKFVCISVLSVSVPLPPPRPPIPSLPVVCSTDCSKKVVLVLSLTFCSFVVPVLLSVFFLFVFLLLFFFLCVVMLSLWSSSSTAAHFALCFTTSSD